VKPDFESEAETTRPPTNRKKISLLTCIAGGLDSSPQGKFFEWTDRKGFFFPISLARGCCDGDFRKTALLWAGVFFLFIKRCRRLQPKQVSVAVKQK